MVKAVALSSVARLLKYTFYRFLTAALKKKWRKFLRCGIYTQTSAQPLTIYILSEAGMRDASK